MFKSKKNYSIHRIKHCTLPLAQRHKLEFSALRGEPKKILILKQSITKSLPVSNGEMEPFVIIKDKSSEALKDLKTETHEGDGKPPPKKALFEDAKKIKEKRISKNEKVELEHVKNQLGPSTSARDIKKNYEKWNFQISNEDSQPKTYEERYQELLKQVDARLTAQKDKLSSVIDEIINKKGRPASIKSNSSYGSEDYTSSDEASGSKSNLSQPPVLTPAIPINEAAMFTQLKAIFAEASEAEREKNAKKAVEAATVAAKMGMVRPDSTKRGRGRPRKNIPEHVDDPLKRKQREYHQTYWVQREQKAKLEVAQKYEFILKEVLRSLVCHEDQESVMKILEKNEIKI